MTDYPLPEWWPRRFHGSARDRFQQLRIALNRAIREALDSGATGKSYDGAWKVEEHWPAEFADFGGYHVVLHLDLYVIGPNRHYQWDGSTWDEALDKATADITAWVAEDFGRAEEEGGW